MSHGTSVGSIAFSPNGEQIVTASDHFGDEQSRAAVIWDVRTCRRLAGPLPHRAEVGPANFNPDGSRIVTVSPVVPLWFGTRAMGEPSWC